MLDSDNDNDNDSDSNNDNDKDKNKVKTITYMIKFIDSADLYRIHYRILSIIYQRLIIKNLKINLLIA